jgi:putative nucleotidyltransferase with HDIG domain
LSRRSQWLIGVEVVVLVLACGIAAAVSTAADWEPPELFFVLLALAIGSDFLAVRHRVQRISGSFLALVLAMALLGPAPAVAMGVASVLVDQVRARNPPARFITNLATYATFPLVGSLLIQGAASALELQEDDLGFSLLILAGFLVSNLLNFLCIAGDYVFHSRGSLAHEFRTIFIPVLPSATVSALLCVLVAFVYVRSGFAALSLLVVVLFTFQYLLRELLASQDRAERLAALQIGVLTSMIETLALRDKMTARHSAAVARYARAMAIALGRPTEEQELAHTAGLLHDIGKFAFPDSILLAEQPLTDEQWEVVRRHPADGARIVQRVDGYGPIAEIVLSHHERWDGGGYPRNLAGEEIPLAARLISVADAYDVLTARDSYRRPISPEAAMAELRRVAGTQFDPRVVETFAGLLGSRDLSFRHGDDADFEEELAFEQRVRAYARRRRGLSAQRTS